MKLLIVLLTYNRLPYTQKTLKMLRETITVPHYLVIVDNYSLDGTQRWLEKHSKANLIILNPHNFYPGKATNLGWERGLLWYPNATHLMRLDNDMHLEPGWDKQAEKYFKNIPRLGQLGLDNGAIQEPQARIFEKEINGMKINPWPGNVGGPCIISRDVWDAGIRYSELPWQHLDIGKPTPQEDVKLSFAIKKAGWEFGHMTERLIWTYACPENWKEFPLYYKKTMLERGYKRVYPWLWDGRKTRVEEN